MSYSVKEKFEVIGEKLNNADKKAVNYLFFADSHVDEYLRKNEAGELRVYEAEEIVEKRLSALVRHLEEAVAFANSRDDIDFIAFGGDGLNAYNIRGKQAALDIEYLNK